MMNYSTSEIARLVGIHPNTVRLYEEMELISQPQRRANGYRVFTSLHVDQFQLARLALRAEVLQNGLRKKALEIIRLTAQEELQAARRTAEEYQQMIKEERDRAEEALQIAESLLLFGEGLSSGCEVIARTRADAARELNITVEALRNWERNGLLQAEKLSSGQRVYGADDLRRLKVIRALRCANYSLTAIRRMLSMLDRHGTVDVRQAVDLPPGHEDARTVCDRLITSLKQLEEDGERLLHKVIEIEMKHYGGA